MVEQAFQVVREFGDIIETEHSGQPFYGMGIAKDPVQQFGTDLPAFRLFGKGGKILAQIPQQIFSLGEKLAHRLL
jgi:hypothetical protein